MIQQILTSWKENRGNLLLLLGVAAGIAMCIVWYFQLIPEVSFVGRSIPGTLISTSATADPNPLVALIRVPAPPEGETFPEARVVVEVYPPSETPHQQFPPLLVQTIQLPHASSLQAVVFSNLGPGQYAAVAYIDLNDNGRFDIDEASSTGEPFSLARPVNEALQAVELVPGDDADPASAPATSEQASGDPSSANATAPLPRGVFDVLPGQATIIEFAFR